MKGAGTRVTILESVWSKFWIGCGLSKQRRGSGQTLPGVQTRRMEFFAITRGGEIAEGSGFSRKNRSSDLTQCLVYP